MNLYVQDQLIDAHVNRLLGPAVAAQLAGGVAQEISVNGDGRIWIDDGGAEMFQIEGKLAPGAIETAVRMVASVNRIWLNADAPFVNTVLSCGARFSAALPPVADGPQLSIRTHARIIRALTDFMTEDQAEEVRSWIAARKNMIIAGGTSSGKTTLLNAIVNCVPDHERLVIVEDAAELQIHKPNVVRRLATEEAPLREHVKQALRARPDRIIVGETRGPECFDMLDAMRTGHSGCLSTVHANSAAQALSRLQTLAGCDASMVREAVNVVLFLHRGSDGRRHLAGVEHINVE